MFYKILTYLARALLSLRYKVEVKGLELLTPERLNRKDGILFMPNHPAHMDPLLVFLLFWPDFRMRPLVVEYVFRTSFLAPFNRLVRALPVPNFEAGVNEMKIKKAEESFRAIAQGIKDGDNFIVYPSGRLKSTGKELLGGASGTHELLTECPDANVVLVRTTGLWGSSFSRAATGRSPDLGKTIWHGVKVILKNFIFFTPRRHILIEVEPNPKGMPRGDVSRTDLNRYLENWYNRYPDEKGHVQEAEPLTLISYSFWKKELLPIKQREQRSGKAGTVNVSEETKAKVYREIRIILENPGLGIKPEQNLAFDLGMDSLNVAELAAFLVKRFDVEEIYPEDMETVGHVLELAQKGKQTGREKKRDAVTFTFPEEEKRLIPAPPSGRTIPEAFLSVAEKMGDATACADDLMGPLSYNKMKKSILVLAQYFRTWEEERVAVMLPASAGAYIVILALQMAGKTPVMLNWTLGPRYLEEMMKLSGAQGIVSSWKFLDRLPNVQFGSCIDKFVLLEDIRKSLSLKMKLTGVFLSKCSAKKIARSMELDKIDENSPCVILFTSGTESVPKGVPLSHKNILSNQRSAMQCITLDEKDVIHGILPPFHSFGFSVAGLLPILSGIKVAFYPDPTDSYALVEGIQRWKITLFCSAPSFLKALLRAAKPEQLQTVRYFVTGAEKTPDDFFEKIKAINPKAKLIEGYGITECSPILTLNRFNMAPKGVGRLLPDVEMITIHPETLVPQPPEVDGEICVRGPNIFKGYLDNPRSPFIEINGKQWYRTGDLGHLEDGSLILSGRLKRFVKVGGEMISLGAVEETIAKALISSGRVSADVSSVAICAEEKEEGRAQLILFSTIDLEKDEANQILNQAGFSNLVKISYVKRIEEIPLMGAGKTDYRSLQAKINE